MEKVDKRKVNLKKLLDYGFIKKDDYYIYEDILLKNKFKIVIIYHNEVLDSKVIDIVTNEEYFLVKVEDILGEYVGKIRKLYLEKLEDVINSCFEKESFKYRQTKDVVNYLKKHYDVKPEYLWDDDLNAAIRHKDTLKWFGALMSVSKDKLGLDTNEVVEIIDLKINPDKIINLVDNQKYFKGYHMNKKYWLTIILDGRVSNEDLFNLIDESYQNTSL